jgi:predicted methyltransferase
VNLQDFTALASHLLAPVLHPGARAVDATAGNGHDTEFLARAVGPSGRVQAWDAQPEAVAATGTRLRAAGLLDRVELRLARHEDWERLLPPDWRGGVRAAMFNLGYRPGGDRSFTTAAASTAAALEACARALAPGGLVTVIAYRGHPGGVEEARAVEAWARALPAARFRVLHITAPNAPAHAPCLWAAQRREEAS